MQHCKRGGIRAFGYSSFQMLFDFSTIRSQMALLTILLCFRLISDVRISHEGRFMQRFSDVVLFYEFWYVEL